MNNINIKTIIISLLAPLFMVACNDDDSAFSGNDNHIASFQLKQGENTFYAAISQDKLTVTVPANLSLQGATATIIISELASISPDPSSITDWDNEQTFTVTSYNGNKQTYIYNVAHNAVSKDGDVALLTQADVDAFAALELSELDGSLTIGAATGQDSIYSLKGLEKLKQVKYDLIINPTYAGSDLEGLENLELIGSLQIMRNKKLKNVTLPKLQAIMLGLTINEGGLETLQFPELLKVDNEISLMNLDSLLVMEFPKLKSVVNNVTLQAGWNINKLQKIHFPALEKIGGKLDITNWKEVTETAFPNLLNVRELNISSLNKLEKMEFPSLEKVEGKMYFAVTNENITAVDFSSLTAINGDFTLPDFPKITTSDWVKSLATVSGKLQIYDSQVTSLKDILPALAEAEELIVSYAPNLSEVDLTRLKVGSLAFEGTSNPKKIIANETCETKLSFRYAVIEKVPDLSGIKHLGGLVISGCNAITEVELNEIESVADDLIFEYCFGFKNLKMPALKEVGAKFFLNGNFATEFDFPLLEKVGVFLYNAQGRQDALVPVDLSFPSLTRSEGYFNVLTSGNGSIVSNLSFPKLAYVGDYFQLSAFTNPENNYIKDLDTFSALTYIGGNVTIEGQRALTSFEGLKNTLEKVLEGESLWTVRNNAYNPTVDDLKAGKWKQP
jgi:hypothetical protein